MPVVGPDLLTVELADGRNLPFPMVLAAQLAAQLPAEERARLPEVAETLNNLGVLNHDQKRMEEARQELGEALQIYEPFAKQDSQRFSADVTRVEKLLGELPK